MKKSKHIGLFTAASVLLAVSVQSATLFYDDFAADEELSEGGAE